MKKLTITLFEYSELSEEAKKHAYQQWYDKHIVDKPHWAEENKNSMEAFAEAIGIEVTDWSYGGHGEGVSWRTGWEYEDEILALTGIRLLKWIHNNLGSVLYKGKYYSLWSKIDQNPYYTEGGHAPWGKLKSKHSKVIFETRQCNLTGYCMDESLLDPFYDFIKNPCQNKDLKDLIEESFHNWVRDCNADSEYKTSREYFEENEAGEHDYEEDGTRRD